MPYCQRCRERKVVKEGDICRSCEVDQIAIDLRTKYEEPISDETLRREALALSNYLHSDDARCLNFVEPGFKRKPGRKPKGPERTFLYEQVYNLRKSGLSFGKIAHKLWGDPSKHNVASAHYQRALKHGFPPIQLSDPEN